MRVIKIICDTALPVFTLSFQTHRKSPQTEASLRQVTPGHLRTDVQATHLLATSDPHRPPPLALSYKLAFLTAINFFFLHAHSASRFVRSLSTRPRSPFGAGWDIPPVGNTRTDWAFNRNLFCTRTQVEAATLKLVLDVWRKNRRYFSGRGPPSAPHVPLKECGS